jgi:putative ABC transport system permease protein
MTAFSALRLALATLLLNRGRSALTGLGIVIGVSAIVALVSAGDGARTKLDDRLESAGKNLIIIRPGGRTATGMVAEFQPLTEGDVAALQREVGSLLVGVVPWQEANALAVSRAGRTSTAVVGTTPDFPRVCNWQVTRGRLFDAEESKRAAAVCLIGQTVVRRLFPDRTDAVGERIVVGALRLRVIGVLGSKGATPLGFDQDDQIFVPLSTLQRKLAGRESLAMLLAAARSLDSLEETQAEIARTLRRRHHVKVGAAPDFDVSSVQELSAFAVTMTRTLQVLVGVIASISLLVGGVGIMNIMLVSVTERTREIGIRRAVGATPADVLSQFLVEAVVLALIGALLGVVLGIAATVAVALVAGWPVIVSPGSILLAFAVTAGVGAFFGYYPAWKASRLDPIAALHYERGERTTTISWVRPSSFNRTHPSSQCRPSCVTEPTPCSTPCGFSTRMR